MFAFCSYGTVPITAVIIAIFPVTLLHEIFATS